MKYKRDKYFQQQESPLAEALLSLIIALTIMSWLLIIRATDEFIKVSPVSQYLMLSLVIIHFLIRRKVIDLLPCLAATVAASIAFYLVMAFIPFIGFGKCGTNLFYLGANVFAFTIFSVQYRLRPALKGGDTNLMLFAVLSLPAFGILYFYMMRTDIFKLFVWNCIASLIIYLFLRQFAVFDSKYKYSITKSSVPVKNLKKQNYKTGIYLAVIFLLLFIILTIIPVLIFSDVLHQLVMSVLPLLVSSLLAFINFLGSIILGDDTVVAPEEGNYLREEAEDSPWVLVLTYFMAVTIFLIAIHVIPKVIRMIIQSAPKYHKETSTTDDGIIVDTIEDINQDHKVHRAKHLYFGEGHERKIRKKFYKKTLHAMNEGLPVSSSSTPGQIETALLAAGDSEIAELRPEYEKVRYGKKEK